MRFDFIIPRRLAHFQGLAALIGLFCRADARASKMPLIPPRARMERRASTTCEPGSRSSMASASASASNSITPPVRARAKQLRLSRGAQWPLQGTSRLPCRWQFGLFHRRQSLEPPPRNRVRCLLQPEPD